MPVAIFTFRRQQIRKPVKAFLFYWSFKLVPQTFKIFFVMHVAHLGRQY